MKIQFNITTSACDLDRFASREDFLAFARDFDGVELMYVEPDQRHIIPKEKVIGLHMSSFPYWLDFWNGNLERVKQEFDTLDAAFSYYGGNTRQALVKRIRENVADAVSHEAEYMVFHVADSGAAETIASTYSHSDEEVIDAVCDLLNEALPEDGPLLLLENLWEPGLTVTNPEMTRRLLRGIRYPKKGIMLDTGHLMHCCPELKNQKEALRFIHQMLDEHGDLCQWVRGIHLNQSLTGNVIKRCQKNPPAMAETYTQRMSQLYSYVFQVDLHRPFAVPGVGELVKRIGPDYLTCEFISDSRQQHEKMLHRQLRALGKEGVFLL